VPTYQYACTDCAERIEVVQKFTDEPLLVCPTCGGRLRKVFSPVGIVFKGSGFYRTDSRAGAAKEAAKEKVTAGAAENGSGSAASGSAKEAAKDRGSAGDKKADKAAATSTSSSSGSTSSSGASSSTSSSSGSKVA
jgi:putative FmdB family regulatory protein